MADKLCIDCKHADKSCPINQRLEPGQPCACYETTTQFPTSRGTTHGGLMQMQAEAENTMRQQVGGDHYKKHDNMQPWAIIEYYGLNYWEGNALKYLLRSKDPAKRAEDLRKGAHYMAHQAARVEAGK